MNRDLRVGIACFQRTACGRQQHVGQRGQGCDGQLLRLALGVGAQAFETRIEFSDHTTCQPSQACATLRQLDAARAAFEQRQSQFFFEIANDLAQGRLRHEELLCGATEVQ